MIERSFIVVITTDCHMDSYSKCTINSDVSFISRLKNGIVNILLWHKRNNTLIFNNIYLLYNSSNIVITQCQFKCNNMIEFLSVMRNVFFYMKKSYS